MTQGIDSEEFRNLLDEYCWASYSGVRLGEADRALIAHIQVRMGQDALDAARYRWLREETASPREDAHVAFYDSAAGAWHSIHDKCKLDARIDAAIAAEKKEGA